MKIAFVDCLPVGGGLSRFSYMLCNSLLQADHDLYIDYYIHRINLERTPEFRNVKSDRFSLKLLEASAPAPILHRAFKKISGRLGLPPAHENNMRAEIKRKIKKYDLAYFPSAHMMSRPDLNLPITGTIHDFNWKYFFGTQIFSTSFVEDMDEAVMGWMQKSYTACSSHDVVTEAGKLYPGIRRYPEVIHLAPLPFAREVQEEEAAKILSELKIDYPYIIFPGNFYAHKNHLNLFTAFSFLQKRKGFENYKLILTGINTEQVAYGIAEKRGIQLITKNSPDQKYNIRGLGYQANHIIDALIKKAKLLVSPSIYEAICTPGMDAWHFGTPTAISDIPPFREHEQVWGIRSAFFDPMDPINIADTIEQYLNNYDKALEDGRRSRENISKYSWHTVASQYLSLFRKAITEE